MKNYLYFFLFFVSHLTAQINHDGDFQFWNYTSIEKKLRKHWTARLGSESRWGDDASKYYLLYWQPQLVFSQKWLEVAPGFRQEYVKDTGHLRVFYNPMIDVTFFKGSVWEVNDRSRIFYRVPKDHAPATWIYRNRLRFTSPEISSYSKLKFFFDDEVFFREPDGFHQNRFCVGLAGVFTTHLSGRIFYMYRSLKGLENWDHQNVLCLHTYINY